MNIAAEDGSAPPTVLDAAAQVLRFTQVARPEDLPLILNALSTAELNAGIARLGPRLPEAVIEHIVTHGPQGARATLAWQLRQPPRAATERNVVYGRNPSNVRSTGNGAPHEGSAHHDVARRKLLTRTDAAIDRALFGRLEQIGIPWIRSAILRDRVGLNGEPVVPPDLRAKLADFLGGAVLPLSPSHLADTDTGDPDFELLRVLASARDFGLSLPAARILGLPGPIPAAQPAWRDQAWVQRWDRPGAGSRPWRLDWDEVLALAADHDAVAGDRGRFLGRVTGLDEAAAREDIPADVRRRLVASYPQAAWHSAAPDVTTLRRISVAVTALRHRWGTFEQLPEFTAAIKNLIIKGLSLGTLTPAEVIEHAVPAGAVLDLAWRPSDELLPAARGRADLAEQLRILLYKRIGDDIPLWSVLLLRAFFWTGTVADLIESTAILGPERALPEEAEIDAFEDLADVVEDIPSANVLIALARPHVGLELLSDGPGELNEFELALLEGCPLPPGLVARALAPDAGPDARRALAANAVTPTAVMERLLHDPTDPMRTLLSVLYDTPDPGIRYTALDLLEKSGTPWEQIMHYLENLGEVRVYQLIAASPNPERLHYLLKKLGRQLGPYTYALLNGRLAESAGPEPVWDAATVIAGAVGEVDPFVRESMARGDIEPLLKAAEIASRRDYAGVTVPDPDQPYEPHPDDPVGWPLENAVRQHLDNRPHRWRIMVHRLMEAGPLEYAQLVDLVEAVGNGAGEAAEGAP